ncbi:MAG: histidine kinase [Rhizobiales bacterium]|nr:histidine kinase [Hyphomicrobiales bacterium]
MPSLFRFLVSVAIMGGLIYGAMFAIAQFYNPPLREITVTIPPDRFLKQK